MILRIFVRTSSKRLLLTMEPSIFITYNPNAPIEEATALRLQTIAHLYGVLVELPDRLGAGAESATRQRLQRAGYVVAFPLQHLSEKVKSELDYAISQRKTIIMVYDKRIGKTVEFNGYANLFETKIDFEQQNTDDVLHDIAKFIRERHTPASNSTHNKPVLSSTEKGLLAFLGIGLGIVALASLLEQRK